MAGRPSPQARRSAAHCPRPNSSACQAPSWWLRFCIRGQSRRHGRVLVRALIYPRQASAHKEPIHPLIVMTYTKQDELCRRGQQRQTVSCHRHHHHGVPLVDLRLVKEGAGHGREVVVARDLLLALPAEARVAVCADHLVAAARLLDGHPAAGAPLARVPHHLRRAERVVHGAA